MRQLVVVVIILIGVALVGAIGSSFLPTAASLEVSPADAKRRRFGLILDVRTPKERERLGFYPNSIPISLQNLVKEVPDLIGTGPAMKQKDILVYSNGDRRAHVAAEMLYDAGFHRVRYLATTYDHLLPGSA
jgi:rhodanese-related sulfurtransferase